MTQVDQVGFSCSACGKQYRWKPELAGKTVKCKCGNPIKVPREMGAAAAPTVARVAKPAKPKPANEDAGGDLDALMALAQQEAASAEDASSNADAQFCPNCRLGMSADAVICTNCGFDRRKGKVLGAAKVIDPNAPKFFGLIKPKADVPGKKKVVDKLAPQGSFLVGLLLSGGLAIVGAILSIIIAFIIKRELFFIIPLVGLGAGLGMQIGQRGYSSLGGLSAALLTLIIIIPTRLIIVLLVVLPAMIAEERASAKGPDAPQRDEIQTGDLNDIFVHHEKSNGAEESLGPPQDPRVLSKVADQVYIDFHINPQFATGDQHNAVMLEARIRATTMPAEAKQKIIDEAEKKAEHEQLIQMAVSEMIDDILTKNPQANLRAAMESIEGVCATKINKMTPEEQKKERARLEEVSKKKQALAQTRFAEMQKKFKQKADEQAVSDGFDSSDADSGADDGMDEDSAEDGDKPATTGDKTAVASTQGARPSNAAAPAKRARAAKPAAPVASSSADGEDGEADSGPSGAGIAFGVILMLIFFGGIWKFLFTISSIFLAYRTAAGSTWG